MMMMVMMVMMVMMRMMMMILDIWGFLCPRACPALGRKGFETFMMSCSPVDVFANNRDYTTKIYTTKTTQQRLHNKG